VPVTIVSPQTGEPFGPGFHVTVETDFIGPLATDAIWQFQLTAPPNEEVLLTSKWAFPVTPLTARMVGNVSVPSNIAFVTPTSVTGQDAQLIVSLDSISTAFHESATVQVILDRNAGQVQELAFWLEDRIAAPGQGLTLEEHDAIVATEASVTTTLGPGVIDLVTGLSGLIVHPALSLGHLVFPGYDLTGDGTIPDLNSATSQAFGLHWTATIPAGFGHLHGQSEEYTMRLWQLRTVHTTAGSEVVTEVQDFHTEGDLWMWQTALPTRIEYSVTPGVVIHAQWWRVGV